MRLGFLSFLPLFFSIFSYAQERTDIELPNISESERYYLELDNYHNTKNFSPQGRSLKTFYFADLETLRKYYPRIEFTISLSKQSNIGSNKAWSERWKKQIILDEKTYESIKRFYPDFVFTPLKGLKVVSHTTYWIWNPSDPTFKPFFMKSFWPNDEFIDSHLKKTDKKRKQKGLPRIQFIPETTQTFEASNKDMIFSETTTMIFRPNFIHTNQEGLLMAPLFGLIGKPGEIEKLAQIKKQTRHEWILSEIIPLFARQQAQINYGYGVFHGSHGQNTVAEINNKTGQLVNFHYRDIRDTIRDATFDLSTKEKKELSTHLNKGDPDRIQGFKKKLFPTDNPGVHLSLYALQNIFTLSEDFETQRKYLLEFFKEYLDQTKTELKGHYKPSPEVYRLLENLRTQTQDEIRAYYQESLARVRVLTGLNAIASQIANQIYVEVANTRVSQLDLTPVPKKIGRRILRETLFKPYVIDPKQKKGPMEYKTNGNRLFLFNQNGKIYAIIGNPSGLYDKYLKDLPLNNFIKRKNWQDIVDSLESPRSGTTHSLSCRKVFK